MNDVLDKFKSWFGSTDNVPVPEPKAPSVPSRIVVPVQTPAPIQASPIHPYTKLAPEYSNMISNMRITRPKEVDAVARKLLRPEIINKHIALSKQTGVPALWYAAVFEREAASNFNLALGQGDPWSKVSTHVPAGKGPFMSWESAAAYYTKYDKLNVSTSAWTMPYAAWKAEGWNGFGPRNRGRHSGYLWSGTNWYDPPSGKGGKYVADGRWDANTIDKQLGVMPLLKRMGELRPELAIPNLSVGGPTSIDPPMTVEGIGGGLPDTRWIQETINELGYTPALVVDGNYGKRTREAVRAFQAHNRLRADGLTGPSTKMALKEALDQVMQA